MLFDLDQVRVESGRVFNHKAPAFNVTSLVQTSPKAGQSGSVGLRRPEVQVSDHWDCRLLRSCRERPYRRVAECHRQEFTAPKENRHLRLPVEYSTAQRWQSGACSRPLWLDGSVFNLDQGTID
jgi:hypothetical protein